MKSRVLLLFVGMVLFATVGITSRTSAQSPMFAPAVTYDSGGVYAWSVAVGDVNGDGKLDLIVANQCGDSNCANGSLSVLLGNGDGTFQTAVSYGSGGLGASSVDLGDVNGDGKPDLLVCVSDSVSVLLGNGDGTFQSAVTYGSGGQGATSAGVADLNGDGNLDLWVTNRCASGNVCVNPLSPVKSALAAQQQESDFGVIGVLMGNGDGTFQAAVTYYSGGYRAGSVAVKDVNGDSKPDLLVTNEVASYLNGDGSDVGVLLGNGDGTFQTAVNYISGGWYARSVAVADVNGDGKPDLVVTNQSPQQIGSDPGSVGVLLGNGDGTFQKAVTYNSGGFATWSVALADVNGDGKLDVVTANLNGDGDAGVLLGNGDGSFQTAVAFGSGGSGAKSIVAADVNGDGKLDLVVANFNTSSVGVMLNITKLPQTINFGSLSNKTYGDVDFTVSATATSSLAVTFAASGECSINGDTVHIAHAGSCTITASQAGDNNYSAATDVSQSFDIAKAVPQITWFNPANIALGTPLSSTELNATANTPGTFTYSPVAGTVLPLGSHTLRVTFNPTDTTDFSNNTASVSITVIPGIPAVLISPTPGSVLSGATVTFRWTAGTNVKKYILYVGTTPDARNVARVNTQTTTSATIRNIPTTGAALYVTLYSKIGGLLYHNSYTYTQYKVAPAIITSPTLGTVLSGATVTFRWTAGTNVKKYILYVGTTPGTRNVARVHTHTTSATIRNIPTTGATLYVRLYSKINGILYHKSYTYTAAMASSETASSSPAHAP